MEEVSSRARTKGFPLLNISVGLLFVPQSGIGVHTGGGELSWRGKLPTRIFVLLQPFPCREITIIDLLLVALLSFVCLVLTDSSSLVTQLTEECHRSDGEQSLEWQTPAVAYPFGSLHDLCVAVVVVLLDEVVRHFRQDLPILLIICHT